MIRVMEKVASPRYSTPPSLPPLFYSPLPPLLYSPLPPLLYSPLPPLLYSPPSPRYSIPSPKPFAGGDPHLFPPLPHPSPHPYLLLGARPILVCLSRVAIAFVLGLYLLTPAGGGGEGG
jgi:hypothetical protein